MQTCNLSAFVLTPFPYVSPSHPPSSTLNSHNATLTPPSTAMARPSSFLHLSLSFLLLFNGCLALSQQQGPNECDIRRIDALEPNERVNAEAGFTDFFGSDDQQFQCAGVEVIRHEIQPQGLLLPSYINAPILFYVEQGSGIQGVMFPGCQETFEVSQKQFHEGRKGGSSFKERHQKLQFFRQGDVVAVPTGAAHWIYNNGDQLLVIVALLDFSNSGNQLDQSHRRFFLAGNPQQGEPLQQQRRPRSWGRGRGSQSPEEDSGNVLNGFDLETLAEAFNVDEQTAQQLQSLDDRRGHIIQVTGALRVLQPPVSRERKESPENAVEETVCTAKLMENIDNPSLADFFDPDAGRCTKLNSFKLPILQSLQLSADRGVLNRNAITSPYWIMNAHSVIYVTNGDMRMQIVNNDGEAVFDGVVRERQLVVVPQHFAMVKQAGEQGCGWIAFRTNSDAMVSSLAGETSAMRGLPVDVIANSYQISREEAERLKYNREEALMFSPGGGSRFSGQCSGGSIFRVLEE